MSQFSFHNKERGEKRGRNFSHPADGYFMFLISLSFGANLDDFNFLLFMNKMENDGMSFF